MWFIRNPDVDLVALSEQELVRCDTHLNAGCDGGWPFIAMEYMQKYGGLVSETEYPYRKVNYDYTQTAGLVLSINLYTLR